MSDIEEISQLILRERQARDQGWWDRMADYYHADSLIEVSWFKGTGAEFIEQSRKTANGGRPPGTHRLSPPAVHLNGDRAFAEVPMALEQRLRVDGVAADLVAAVRVLYRIRRAKTDWKIQATVCVYGRDTLTAVVPGTTIDIDEEKLNRYREPYRFLAYCLTKDGHTVTDDLYGDDEPERIAQLYQAAFDWLQEKEGR